MRFGCILLAFLAPAVSANADNGSGQRPPYEKSGVVNCTVPGTSVQFALNGSGGAELTQLSTDYARFEMAGEVKTWSATTMELQGTTLLVLDNLNQTRIMIKPDGQGMAFTTSEGVADMLCQVNISPE
ncbi:hypothetical protein HFO55_28910 [Rhizobium leguminosarum]|uniref:hypothetical protein n=1 Tax=Rhizobium leguminosarum TaxID=384 RepID=UPI001C94C46D|nr:hypothetical protein [Rhizobium leguminosarum]MBY5571202.1 hypothetical protein [Rhizobium leguminosarum]MBY5577782.1 hypothetical protein [Rhizobium leguminosarum]